MWTQNVVSTIMWRLNKSFMWIFSHITFLMSDVTYLNKDKVPLQIYLFIYFFFCEEEDINFINQSWRNPNELHCKFVVEHPSSTRQNLRHS